MYYQQVNKIDLNFTPMILRKTLKNGVVHNTIPNKCTKTFIVENKKENYERMPLEFRNFMEKLTEKKSI
jgi:hypothetical protein